MVLKLSPALGPLVLASLALAAGDSDRPHYEPTKDLLDTKHVGYAFKANQIATLAYVASSTTALPPVPWYCPRTLD